MDSQANCHENGVVPIMLNITTDGQTEHRLYIVIILSGDYVS